MDHDGAEVLVTGRMDPGVGAARFGAQLLTERPARSVVDVARHLLAVQAQDARKARLAVRARSAGTSAADVDYALSVDRSLAVGWLDRGTCTSWPRRTTGGSTR